MTSENKFSKFYNLVNEFILWEKSGETKEELSIGSDVSTTEYKEKIRKERLSAILPELKKEYEIFCAIAKNLHIANFLYNISYKITSKISAASVIILALIFPYGLAIIPISLILRKIAIELIVSKKIEKRIRKKMVKELRETLHKKNSSSSNIIKSDKFSTQINELLCYFCPYISAFLYINGFGYNIFTGKDQFDKYNAGCASLENEMPLITKDMCNLTFEQFINYIKLNMEAMNNSYKDENIIFNCIFFYIDEKTLQENKKSREKVREHLVKHDKKYMDDIICYSNKLIESVKSMEIPNRDYSPSTTSGYSSSTTNSYSNSNTSTDDRIDRRKNKFNTSLATDLCFIESKIIKVCASILTGEEDYDYCEYLFGLVATGEERVNWTWFTKSIVESNEYYTSNISNKDLRYAAESIIRKSLYNLGMIENRDLRAFSEAVIEKNSSKHTFINNRDIAILTKVVCENGII